MFLNFQDDREVIEEIEFKGEYNIIYLFIYEFRVIWINYCHYA